MAFALTFDDGPGTSTPELMKVLRAHECRATFFMLGKNLQHSDLSQAAGKLLRDKHLIGNHTMSHKVGTASELRREIEECDRIIAKLYDQAMVPCPRPIPFRLPFGIRTFIGERVDGGIRKPAAALDNRLQVIASMGRTHVHWTAIFPDWEAKSAKDAARIAEGAIEHIAKMAEEGLDAVIALHDSSPPDDRGMVESREYTVQAVDQILTNAKKKSWTTFRTPVV